VKVLLVSTYEMGHQPLHVAIPAAALREAGHEVRAVDLSVQAWEPSEVAWADAVAFSVPMHTAMRIALQAAATVAKPTCFYGLYAMTGPPGARLISGEYVEGLVRWADDLAPGATTTLDRAPAPTPDRTVLPALDRYARLQTPEGEVPAGYVEATRGCSHRCRHCPVPVVYDGRTRRVSVDTVLADVEAQVRAGARHITFGDPDFLNRSRHAMAVVDAVHDAFPHLTYDVTAKVDHLLRHADLLPRLSATGCLFVVSAFESMDDRVLRILDKGHTAADSGRVVHLLRSHGIEVRPSWLPFTPWTTVRTVSDILRFVVDHDLVGNVDPVQYSIRLLVPPGSLLLDVAEMKQRLGPYDPQALTYTWTAEDPHADELQGAIAGLVADTARHPLDQFFDIWEAVHGPGAPQIEVGSTEGRPRLTEPWFC